MIDGYWYQYIYLFIVSVLTFAVVQYRKDLNLKENISGSLFLCIFLILFIGFRPHSGAFGDTINYASCWGKASWSGWNWDMENKIFDNIYNGMGSLYPDATWFFVLIASIYFLFMLFACRKFIPSNTLIAFLVCLAAFSTFSYGTNGIKAGAAASIFLLALAYRDNLLISIPLVLLSWGFHHSMQVPVAAYICTLFFKDNKWYLYGWLFCLAMAIGHISFFQNLFTGFTDSSGAGYLGWKESDGSWGGKSGLRLDFILYSAMPIVMGYYVKYKYELEDLIYDNILNVYLFCNGIWMLCMYAQFTNRIAYLSWFMYPIVLIYPCYSIEDEDHPLVLARKKIVLLHLGFTLFMSLIYY